MPLLRMNNQHSNKWVTGFLIFLSLMALGSCGKSSDGPSPEDVKALHSWLDSRKDTPVRQILEIRNREEIEKTLVFVQDSPVQADFITLMDAVYPTFYSEGFNRIAVFFLRSDDQEEIDQLTGFSNDGTEPDGEPLNREILRSRAAALIFSANPVYGYQEYVDFLLNLREFNTRLPGTHPPLRILGLNNGGMLPDAGTNQESDGSSSTIFWLTAETFQNGTGLNRENSVVVALHSPSDKKYRWNGLMETVATNLRLRDRSYAFETSNPPFPGWAQDAPDYPIDIYVVTAFEFNTTTPIEKFITSERIEDRLTRIKLKSAIKKAARNHERRLRRLKPVPSSIE